MAHKGTVGLAEKVGTLPAGVVTPADLGRLLRGLETIIEEMQQASLRSGHAVELPHASTLLQSTASLNDLSLAKSEDRENLLQFLQSAHGHAPILHMSFSAEPSTIFVERLITWLRKEIHPVALLSIGLQPNIGVGCMLRTTNKQFDFSLRKQFEAQSDLLMTALRESA